MRLLAIAGLVVLVLGGIVSRVVPERPRMEPEVQAPDQIVDFDVLYRQNCSGCHGENGAGGAATPLGNTTYLALADDSTIRRVTSGGVPGTSMPAFAQSAGGMLTDKQIDVLVNGMRARWGNPHAVESANLPPYSTQAAGDPSRGSGVFATYCASCHGTNGTGGQKGASVVNGSFLALISDQGLRTTVIVGRPELGFPDWRNDVPGRPMSAQEVSDVVAWMTAQRPKFPGQPYSLPPKAGESR